MGLTTRPISFEHKGRQYVAYCSSRLTFKRAAVERMGRRDRLLIVVTGSPDRWFEFSLADLRNDFDNVLQSGSYLAGGVYTWYQIPRKALAYEIPVGSIPVPDDDHRQAGAQQEPRARREPAPARQGLPSENLSYIAAVRAWRDCWRPRRVRFLLVAESHVAEMPGDAAVRVMIPGHAQLPGAFCRLVYCLGYGESALCSRPPSSNYGTWQYWDLLGAVAGGVGNKQPRKNKSSLECRLKWKLETLEQLQYMGVWLVDASVVALYRPGGSKPASGAVYDDLVRDSWETSVWPDVKGDAPEQTWVIGRMVGGALQGHPAIRADQVIPQPQSRKTQEYRRELARMANSIRKACGC